MWSSKYLTLEGGDPIRKGVLVAAFLALCIGLYVLKLVRDPLRGVPGPVLARFTRLWELQSVRRGNFQKTHIDLHSQYGKIVRLGPNRYSINDVEASGQIYHHGSKFVKAAFYHPFGNPDADLADTFSERSIERHAQKRRKVASLYSMSTLLSYEQYVDRCDAIFIKKMHQFADSGVTVDTPSWLQYYAFDVIGEISVGQPFGFMTSGTDRIGILDAIHQSMVYGSRVGIVPELHRILGIVAQVVKMPVPFDIVLQFIKANIQARENGDQLSDRNDFLTKLMKLKAENKIEDLDVVTTLGANIAAGSDTTALTLSTVVYHLAKNPDKLGALRHELRQGEHDGLISSPITYQESQKLPYLQAIIKESLRIHPATGQMLARVVPRGGAILCGKFFPAGTEVGTSPWLIHFNEDIFGSDAHSFKPERWLVDEKRSSQMNMNLLSFGAGARTCLGKNISLLEMSKIIPELYRRFDFELDSPDKEWELDNVWFVKQKFNCRVKLALD